MDVLCMSAASSKLVGSSPDSTDLEGLGLFGLRGPGDTLLPLPGDTCCRVGRTDDGPPWSSPSAAPAAVSLLGVGTKPRVAHIQGWHSASLAVMRVAGLRSSMRDTSSLAAGEMPAHRLRGNSTSCVLVPEMIS